jgi:AraC-like DNA-binding protein
VKQTTKQDLLQRLEAAKDYIDERFLEIAEIREVAEHCAMSEYHFYRRFKEVYNQTPNQYLTEKKLLFAKELLLQKKLTVTEVANACNYPDVFTFSKAFKKFFGITPSSLR